MIYRVKWSASWASMDGWMEVKSSIPPPSTNPTRGIRSLSEERLCHSKELWRVILAERARGKFFLAATRARVNDWRLADKPLQQIFQLVGFITDCFFVLFCAFCVVGHILAFVCLNRSLIDHSRLVWNVWFSVSSIFRIFSWNMSKLNILSKK